MSLEIPTKESNKKKKDQTLLNAFNEKFNEQYTDVSIVKRLLNSPQVRPWYMEFKEKIAEQNRVDNGWRPPRSSRSQSSSTVLPPSSINELPTGSFTPSSTSNLSNTTLLTSTATLHQSNLNQDYHDSTDPLIQNLIKEYNNKRSSLIRDHEMSLKKLEDDYNQRIQNVELHTFLKNTSLDDR